MRNLPLAFCASIAFIGCEKKVDIEKVRELSKYYSENVSCNRVILSDTLTCFENPLVATDDVKAGLRERMIFASVIRIDKAGSKVEYILKTGYEFTEGLLQATEPLDIRNYDRINKFTNDGWFLFQKTYTRYRN